MADPNRPCKEHEALGIGVDSCLACHRRMYEGVPSGMDPTDYKMLRAQAFLMATAMVAGPGSEWPEGEAGAEAKRLYGIFLEGAVRAYRGGVDGA